MKKLISLFVTLALIASLVGCSTKTSDTKGSTANESETPAQETNTSEESEESVEEVVVVGIAESAMNHQFRVKQVEENKSYAQENFPGKYEFIVTDANGEVTKQVKDIEDLIAANVDVIMVSPLSLDGLNAVLQQALDKGIKVVTLDSRASVDVSLHVGSSDFLIGQEVAKALCEAIGDSGKVIEIQGTAGTTATTERDGGFREELKNHPDVEIIEEQYCDYNGTKAMTYMEDMLTKYKEGEIAAVFAHNDQMAMAAAQAIEAVGRTDEIAVFGIDGENAAFELISQGLMTGTCTYSYCAPEGIIAVEQLLSGELKEKEVVIPANTVTKDNVEDWLGKGF